MDYKIKILLVEDNEFHAKTLSTYLKEEGFSITLAHNRINAEKELRTNRFNLAILDICLDETDNENKDGLEILKFIREKALFMPVAIYSQLTDAGTVRIALSDLGADSWLPKGKPKEVAQQIKRLVNDKIFDKIIKKFSSESLILGYSQEALDLKKRIYIAANADSSASVLILGETGTGKTLIAKEIHRQSSRSKKKFVDINCAAIPDNLLESELFGYEKGAFTDAIKTKKGKIEIADGGTLFLDEICDMSLKLQAKLLKILEEREFSRLGSNEVLHSGFQLISATNKNIYDLVRKGEFREDLFYRIKKIIIKTIPLREMKEMIPKLAFEYIRKTSIEGFTVESLEALKKRSWKGNIREFFDVIDRSILHHELEGGFLDAGHLEFDEYDDNPGYGNDTVPDNGSLNVSFEITRLKLQIIEKAAKLSKGRKVKIVDRLEDIHDRDWPRKTILKAEKAFPGILDDFPYLKGLYFDRE